MLYRRIQTGCISFGFRAACEDSRGTEGGVPIASRDLAALAPDGHLMLRLSMWCAEAKQRILVGFARLCGAFTRHLSGSRNRN